MTAPVDRSLWLDRFVAGGMVSSLQQLNGLPQQEFDDLSQVFDFQSPDIMDLPIMEASAGTEQPVRACGPRFGSKNIDQTPK
jgi:hypothetical protein